ncbi:hypothetical protein B0H14DRAFT_3178674, partial [Mycena olivaceomarginata]
MVVPYRRRRFYRLLPRQERLQQVPLSPIHTQAGRILNTRTTLARAAATAPQLSPTPPVATVSSSSLFSARSQLLSGTGSTTRSKCNERSWSPAPPSSPLRAPRPSSAPTPPSAPNLGLPRIATATCTTPGVSLCGHPNRPVTSPLSASHPQRHSAPLVADSATQRPMRSTPRGGFPSPAPAAFAAMTRLRASSGRTTRRRYAPRASAVPAFRAKDFRQAWMGHPDKSRRDEPGGDSRTYAAPGFQIVCSSDLRRVLRVRGWVLRECRRSLTRVDAPSSAQLRYDIRLRGVPRNGGYGGEFPSPRPWISAR